MDWSSYNSPYVGPQSDNNIFRPGKESELSEPCRALILLDSGKFKTVGFENGQKDWEDIFSNVHEKGPLSSDILDPNSKSAKGFCVVVCGRAKDVIKGEIPAELFHLPMPRDSWEKITQRFHIHEHITAAMRAKTTYSCVTTHVERRNGSIMDTLNMYTGVMGDFTPDNIGISVTHSRKRKLTLAILYGCSKQQMEEATRLLRQCESTSHNVKEHPFVVIGTYSELQYKALQVRTEEVITEWVEFRSKLLNTSYDDAEVKKLNAELRTIREKINTVESEIRIAQRYLKRLINHLDDMFESGDKEFQDTTKFLKQRFEELEGIYEDLVVKCGMTSNEMSHVTNLFMAELARMEAKSVNQKARMSTVLALVATMYLPAATIAAIFAMPVFDFKNRWLDLNWHPVASNSSQREGDHDPENSFNMEQPVMSAYFWVYLILASVLTFLTLGIWWFNRITFNAEESLPSNLQNQQVDSKEDAHDTGTTHSAVNRDRTPKIRILESLWECYEHWKVRWSRRLSQDDIESNEMNGIRRTQDTVLPT